jgi:DNA primase catalytic subunit
MVSWTVGEFQDYPLVVQSGNRGTIVEVDESQRRVCVEWDDDEFKRMKKYLSLEGAPESWSIKAL